MSSDLPEFLFLGGIAMLVAGLALLGHTDAAGGSALGAGIVWILRAFWETGAP